MKKVLIVLMIVVFTLISTNIAYSAAPINLVGHWGFDDIIDYLIIEDLSTSGYDALFNNYNGTYLVVLDDTNSAVMLDGIDDSLYLNTPYPEKLIFNGINSFTIMARIKPSDLSETLQGIVKKYDGSGGYQIYVNNNKIKVNIASTSSFTVLQGDTTLIENQWYDIVFVFKNEPLMSTPKIKLYVDGNLDKMQNYNLDNVGPGGQLIIGAINSNYYEGLVDDIKIYNVALSDQTICENSDKTWIYNTCLGEIAETITITSPMIINENTDLDHNIIAEGIDAIHISTSGITLDCHGHTITGDGSGNGIVINGVNDVTVRDCIFQNFYDGIKINNTIDSHFEKNTFLYMKDDGVDGESNNEGNIFVENTFKHIGLTVGNGHGIYLHLGEDNTVEKNIIEDVGKNGIYLRYDSEAKVINNNISEIGNYGIRIVGGPDTIIQNNSIEESTDGIRVQDVSRISLEQNTVKDSSYGIRFVGGVTSADVSSNRLCDITGRSFFCTGSSYPTTGSLNYGLTNLHLCADGSPTNAFHTCFEQDACNDNRDNDGDGLVDCMDEDCNYQRCGESSICFENLCTDVRNTDIPTATTVPIEVLNPVIFDTYYDLFTFLNTGIVVSVPISNSGICNDVCATNGKICGFAQGGMNTCSEIGSEYCTCY